MNENDPKKYDGFYGHGIEDSEWRKSAREENAFDAQARKDKIIADMTLRNGSYSRTYGENLLNKMDSMIASYKRQKSRESHPVADVMEVLNTDAFEIGRRRAEAINGIGRTYSRREPTRAQMILGVIICIITGLVMAGEALVMNVAQVTRAQEMEKLMSVYTPVEGVAYHSSAWGKTSRYLVITYKYEYEGKEYIGKCRTTREKEAELGLYLSLNMAQDKNITVYVDPEKPERSIYLPEPYPSLLSWFLIPGGVALVIGAVLYYYRRR